MSSAGRLLALAAGELKLPWRLRVVPVCSSTEGLLSQWLASAGPPPLAVLARRQRHGRGQHGRSWQSPPGGLWLSAALPWQGPPPTDDPSQLPLLVAAELAAELAELAAAAGAAPLRIKAPNDLMVGRRKLAGVLTSAVWRGAELQQLRIGIGLNGRHPIRPPGITLEQWLGAGRCPPWPRLALMGLRALERLACRDQAWDTGRSCR